MSVILARPSRGTPEAGETAGPLSGMLPAILLLLAGLVALLLASALTDGVDGQFVVIAPPGRSLPEIFTLVSQAQGAVVETGGFGNIVIAASTAPDFAPALREAGAWFVFAAPRLLGCTGTAAPGAAE